MPGTDRCFNARAALKMLNGWKTTQERVGGSAHAVETAVRTFTRVLEANAEDLEKIKLARAALQAEEKAVVRKIEEYKVRLHKWTTPPHVPLPQRVEREGASRRDSCRPNRSQSFGARN